MFCSANRRQVLRTLFFAAVIFFHSNWYECCASDLPADFSFSFPTRRWVPCAIHLSGSTRRSVASCENFCVECEHFGMREMHRAHVSVPQTYECNYLFRFIRKYVDGRANATKSFAISIQSNGRRDKWARRIWWVNDTCFWCALPVAWPRHSRE